MAQQMQLPYEPQALEAAIAGGGPEDESVQPPTGQMDPQQLMQMLLQMGVAPDKIKAILEILMGGGAGPSGPPVG